MDCQKKVKMAYVQRTVACEDVAVAERDQVGSTETQEGIRGQAQGLEAVTGDQLAITVGYSAPQK